MSKIIVPLHFAKLTTTPGNVEIGFKKFYLKGEWFKLYNGASEIDVVLDRPLDNYVPKIGTITSSDTVLTAIEKLDYAIGNINPNVLWGSITGNILLQTDLIAYIAALPASTLQQVVNSGNGISNFGGIGNASIQSTNFTNNRTLYLNDSAFPTIRIVDNLNASNNLQIDLDTLTIDGVSYSWASIVNPPASPLSALPFTTDHLTATNNQYVIGDLVWYLGDVYRCIANNDSIIPTSTLYWTSLGAGYPLVQQPADWNSTSGNNQILNKPTIPSTPTLQEVLDEGDSAVDSAIFFSNTANDFETSVNEFGDGRIILKSVVNDFLTEVIAGQVYLGTVNGSDNVIISKDGINVDTVNYAFPSGASSPLATLADIPSGGVTSVGLTMPSAFTVTNSPITSSGDIAVTGAGLVSQYVRGDGTLANFPNSTGGGSSVNYYLNGSVSQGTFGGDTYYQMSKTPILGAGTNFTRTNGAGNGYIASFITDAGDPSQLNIPGGNWNVEFYFNASSGGGSPSFYAELYKVSATNVFTLIASDSLNPEGITNGITVDQYFTSIPVPQTTLLVTDRLAVRIFVNTGGRTITLHTENGNLSEVLTTFTTGLTALNGLTDQVQFFDVGTGATNFNISSSGDTHTFNLLFNIRRNANNSSNNNINYNGYAVTGSAESSAVWTITRLTIAASGSITVATATNVAWTNRESATYI